jgi:hypothetical protein
MKRFILAVPSTNQSKLPFLEIYKRSILAKQIQSLHMSQVCLTAIAGQCYIFNKIWDILLSQISGVKHSLEPFCITYTFCKANLIT